MIVAARIEGLEEENDTERKHKLRHELLCFKRYMGKRIIYEKR